MSGVSGVGVLTAFLAGVVSFLSPCVLPLVPGFISYMAGQSLEAGQPREKLSARLTALNQSVFFVLGFSTVFVALGASATALGQLLLRYRAETNIVGGSIIIVFGLFMAGVVKLPWLQRDLRFHRHIEQGRPLAAYLLGLAFAFGWTPCIGPVLGAILTVSAVSPVASHGVALLGVYSLGLGIPFLATALFTGVFLSGLSVLRRLGRTLQVVAGGVLVLMGVAMVSGWLADFSYWLLSTFPALAKIG